MCLSVEMLERICHHVNWVRTQLGLKVKSGLCVCTQVLVMGRYSFKKKIFFIFIFCVKTYFSKIAIKIVEFFSGRL